MKVRQQFMTSAHYAEMYDFLRAEEPYWDQHEIEADSLAQGLALKAQRIYQSKLQMVFLQYTAGGDIQGLQAFLVAAIDGFEKYQRLLATSEGVENIAPLIIDDWLPDYEECVQTISFCVLLGRIDLLVRYVAIMDGAGFKWQDTLYEDLLRRVLVDRKDIDQWHHPEYTKLIKAVYASDKRESSELLSQYCSEWYAFFDQAPWHDSHKDGVDGSYCGYWSFEAGAIAYLYGIDDSAIGHMVYPKDLVEYARNTKVLDASGLIVKVYPGQPCPRTGYWFTPAESSSRCLFEQGDLMPEFKGARWGATIWYWSGETE